MKALLHTGTTPSVPAAAIGPADPHSEGSGWAQGSRFWARSKPGAGRHLWAGLSPEAISVAGTAELRIIPCMECCFIAPFIIWTQRNASRLKLHTHTGLVTKKHINYTTVSMF